MALTFRVRVVDAEGQRAWRAQIPRSPGGNPCEEDRAFIEAAGETILRWHVPFAAGPDAGRLRFAWCCPGCGGSVGGFVGEETASGQEDPQWVNTGTLERPTLTPALACPLWKAGRCRGRWQLTDGTLAQL